MVKVLFVCLGNICRSPTAHVVFEHKVAQKNLAHYFEIDSAGTAAHHVNQPPDKRAQREAKQRGYDLSRLRARQVTASDFSGFDYILAMDVENLSSLRKACLPQYLHKVALFLPYGGGAEVEVPDPYYGGEEGFSHVLDLVEQASNGLLCEITKQRHLQ
ncbi:MAG: low molecular weight phosphotyrosine protein phosphatase [Gammaproteobacteria bacterium]|nr:low molecular weight phosphotyrosine protein phosphatase [Gammaproteobacteria bacterium]